MAWLVVWAASVPGPGHRVRRPLGQPVSAVFQFVQPARRLGSGAPVPYPFSFFFTVDSAPRGVAATADARAERHGGDTGAGPGACPAGRGAADASRRARLAELVQELTAARAATLHARGNELRCIERDLRDGAQARMAAGLPCAW
ncbi:hypothetical protein [Streptomyces sp. x-19]|uniref:hypothetical protein n=1 Tax=Streptomyces sp. x-19 TaxID=2789280 RepID=UPI00397EEF5F